MNDEEEIIEIITRLLKDFENFENMRNYDKQLNIYSWNSYDDIFKEYKQAIQGLLDLYKTEKEKNKRLEKTILEFVNDRERILKTPVISKDKIREKIKELKEEIYLARKEKDLVIGVELELQKEE